MKPLATLAAAALLLGGLHARDDAPAKLTPKQALQPLQDLIGSWRGTGEPAGTRAEKQRGFWQETVSWEWRFKGDDAWLRAKVDKGKYFTSADLHYLPDRGVYRLVATTPAKESLTFEGPLKDRKLTLERTDGASKESQRLVLSLLHANRYLLAYETRPDARPSFRQVYQVGATKEGVAFAGDADNAPQCVVSGGLGKIPVTHKGKTYYVCCTGCRDAFADDPEKYIKEYEERKAKAK
jgi:hypothetical protein